MLIARLKKLSPAMKVTGGIAAFFSSIAGIAGFILVIHPFTNFNPDVVGHWESDYSYPITGGKFSFKGKTDFFHEGKYNVAGVITLEGKAKEQNFKYTYNVVGAGNWMADSERMSITLQNMHSFAKSIKIADVDFTPRLAEQLSGMKTPELSESFPGGMSDEYTLESISPQIMVFRATDPFGKPFTIKMHRQS